MSTNDERKSVSLNEATHVVVCRCGATIPDDEVDYWNGCNEEGEEYGVVTVQCLSCKADYETSQWGEWDDKSDAVQYLTDYIKGMYNSTQRTGIAAGGIFYNVQPGAAAQLKI